MDTVENNYLISSIGIYEKALPDQLSWAERFLIAGNAGYSFIEVSIDESDWRIERLDWDPKKRADLRNIAMDTGVSIMTICLSAHRRFPLGSADEKKRQKGIDILKKAIDFALDTNARIILVPGYDVFYEPSDEGTKARFSEVLVQAGQWAGRECVMLALENTDKFITSISEAKKYIDQLDTPWFQIYGDVGNLVGCGHDVLDELEVGAGHLAGIHLKDATLGRIRDVPFGEGHVPFREIFSKLVKIKFQGPLMLELWDDPASNCIERISQARKWISSQIMESQQTGPLGNSA